MKKIFEILQKPWCPVVLGILFLSVAKWTKDFGLTATWIILVASTVVFILVLWNLLSNWEVKRQGYLIANAGGALSGIISSLIIFTYAHGSMSDSQFNLFLLISICIGIAVFSWGISNEWSVRPWNNDKGQAPRQPQKLHLIHQEKMADSS